MKVFFSILIITSFFIVAPVFAAVDTTHVGFVNSSLWFEREPFFSGESVRVYSTLANSTPADFNGMVRFYDNDIEIGKKEVTLERNGGFQVVFVDWTPTTGEHSVSVKITNATLKEPGKEPEPIADSNALSYSISRSIEGDSDKDGIPDSKDTSVPPTGVTLAEPKKPEEKKLIDNLESAATSIFERIGEVASNTSPQVVSGLQKVLSTVEDFRVAKNSNVNEGIKSVKQKIAEDTATSSEFPEGEKKNDPFNQLQLLALTVAGYTLSNTIAFYLVGAFLLYIIVWKIIPWIYRKVRGDSAF